MNRTPRELDTRDGLETYVPPDSLPVPEERSGWVHRWVRVATYNEADPGNLTARRREGWEPCDAKDYPELNSIIEMQKDGSDHIVYRGLILCRMPAEKAEARKRYYEAKAKAQVEGVDNNFMRQEDSRMPLFVERQSTTSFGSGTR